ncbi:hypothetical protein B9Z55_022730 [Caenorhabditis nigoni]|uniref:Uncharacterized protein n=1 Tax=Caenorhabditis nigoni TaxID=1611254 RepID=A0A2G5SLZ9_9PELO|nr:hypothetical protein B9Z55_022730 [Caenorhabditis nigoni]
MTPPSSTPRKSVRTRKPVERFQSDYNNSSAEKADGNNRSNASPKTPGSSDVSGSPLSPPNAVVSESVSSSSNLLSARVNSKDILAGTSSSDSSGPKLHSRAVPHSKAVPKKIQNLDYMDSDEPVKKKGRNESVGEAAGSRIGMKDNAMHNPAPNIGLLSSSFPRQQSEPTVTTCAQTASRRAPSFTSSVTSNLNYGTGSIVTGRKNLADEPHPRSRSSSTDSIQLEYTVTFPESDSESTTDSDDDEAKGPNEYRIVDAGLAVVPWPLSPPTLIGDRVLPPREIIIDGFLEGPAPAPNQFPMEIPLEFIDLPPHFLPMFVPFFEIPNLF